MSYQTNPILNRMTINKGWKNPYLPTKTLNYSRDISLWFKVYLLLKFFLILKKIQLVSCEIRFDEQNKKIIYLRINKKGTLRKKRKRKNHVLNKLLKRIKTPMLKSKNEDSIYFLYKNLILLKNLSFWNKNSIHKKSLSNLWLSKPKISTWLTSLKKITLLRQVSKKTAIAVDARKILKKKDLKSKFYTTKQKQLLANIARIKKKKFSFVFKIICFSKTKKNKNITKINKKLKKRNYSKQNKHSKNNRSL